MDRFGVLWAMFLLSVFFFAEGNVISLGSMLEWLDPNLKSIFGAYGKFSRYGCYCGIGGSGRPVDQLDCCCQMHDACYSKLSKDGTCTKMGTFSHLYTFSKFKIDGRPQIKCEKSDDLCASQLCECDKDVAICLAKHESKYNAKYRNYDRSTKCMKEKWMQADFCEG